MRNYSNENSTFILETGAGRFAHTVWFLDIEMCLLDKLMSWRNANESIKIEKEEPDYEPTEEDFKKYFAGISEQVTQVNSWIQILRNYGNLERVCGLRIIFCCCWTKYYVYSFLIFFAWMSHCTLEMVQVTLM